MDEWFHLFGGEELPVPKKTHTKKALSGLSGLWRTEGWMGLKSQIQCWNGRCSNSVSLQEKTEASHHYHSTDTCVISQSVELDVFCSDSWFSALMCCDIFQMHSNLVFKAVHESSICLLFICQDCHVWCPVWFKGGIMSFKASIVHWIFIIDKSSQVKRAIIMFRVVALKHQFVASFLLKL